MELSPDRALADLLMSCFHASELRRLARYEYSALALDLPGESASLAALSFTFVDLLRAHGRVDAELFALLRRERPGRAADIDRVAAQLGLGASRGRPEEGAAWRWLGPDPEDPRARSLAGALVRLELWDEDEDEDGASAGRGWDAWATGWLLAPGLVLAPASALLRPQARGATRDGRGATRDARGAEATLAARARRARGYPGIAAEEGEDVALHGAEVAAWDLEADFVLLRMAGPSGVAPPLLNLPPPALPARGAALCALGLLVDGAIGATAPAGRVDAAGPDRLAWRADHPWLAGALACDADWRPVAVVLGAPRGPETRDQRREALPLSRVLALLARRSPGAWRALDEARGGALAQAGAPAPDEGALDREAFRARLKLQLADLGPPDAPERDGWVAAAAVLGPFAPTALRPLPPAQGTAVGRLAGRCAEDAEGRWTLDLDLRRAALRALHDDGRLDEALAANPELRGPTGALLALVHREGPLEPRDLARLDLGGLQAATELSRWLEDPRRVTTAPDLLHGLVERQARIGPLRRLVGDHFRGREEERARLDAHLRAGGDPRILVLWGPGGVGKSALLGAWLLDREREARDAGLPWAYLDFDDPRTDPLDPRGLLVQLARQLAWLYAASDTARALLDVESAFDGDLLSRSAALLVTAGGSLDEQCRALADRLAGLVPPGTPLLLVMDTFEQVQVKGDPAVDAVRAFVDGLAGAWPALRVVLSGRGPVPQWTDAPDLPLGDLDPEAADAVLQARGVSSPQMRALLIHRLGGNPLTLTLAARVAARASSSEDLAGRLAALAGAEASELQGQLYTRILGHIHDERVRALAHPGLVVRRVTPPILEGFLAALCGLPAADAASLFDGLARQVDLFSRGEAEPDGAPVLVHRQDVRVIMLRQMLRVPQTRAAAERIHQAAEDWYAPRTDAVGRGERLYHALMCDRPPEALDALWAEDLVGSLARSWEEPLPDRARAWLAPRLGQASLEGPGLRLLDWELAALREARDLARSGRREDALAVIEARSDRSPGSPLVPLHGELLRELGRLDQARAVIDAGLALAEQGGGGPRTGLALVGARVALAAGEAARVAALLAVVEASVEATAAERLEAGLLRLEAARRLGGEEAPARHALEARLAATPPEALVANEELAMRLLRTLGGGSTVALTAGLRAFADRSTGAAFKVDVYGLGEALERASLGEGFDARRRALTVDLGVSARRASLTELVGAAARHGRLAELLTTALDHAADPSTVGDDLLAFFHEPPDGDSP